MIQNFVKGVGDTANTIFIKPTKKLIEWGTDLANWWKTKSDTQIKEELIDPTKRNNLWHNIKRLIKAGLIIQAGALFNPLIWYYQLTKWWARRGSNVQRLREEIMSEIPAEIEIIDDKIRVLEGKHEYKKVAQLKRMKAQLQLQLRRVGDPGKEVTY